MMSSGLICAYRLDGKGSGEIIDSNGCLDTDPGLLWMHFDRRHQGTGSWLSARLRMDAETVRFLLGNNPRPRVSIQVETVMVSLRGLRVVPRAQPSEILSVQIWIDSRRFLTFRDNQSLAISETRRLIDRCSGPKEAGAMLVQIADLLVARMDDVITEAKAEAHALGHRGAKGHTEIPLGELASLRCQLIRLGRYLIPQRRALARLAEAWVSWRGPEERGLLRAVSEQTAEYSDALNASLEIAEIAQEEFLQRSSERTNRRWALTDTKPRRADLHVTCRRG
jgi:zinc transporter